MILQETFFGLCACAAIVGALLTVLARNPIRSALALLLAILGVAGLFASLGAQFLAAIELIVYAGAIVVLFVFVIMLIGPDAVVARDRRGWLSRAVGGIVIGVGGLTTAVLVLSTAGPKRPPPLRLELGTIDAFGRELFTRGLLPFELATALFVVAIVGAIAVGRSPTRQGVGQASPGDTKGDPS
jgi:NADH-quinone oxidoreductase subunit J